MPKPSTPAASKPRTGAARRVTLASVVGAVTAALLLTHIPQDESGRTVKVDIEPKTGQATVQHVSGKQYLKVYLDIVGVATVCDGITRYKGRPLQRSMTFTEVQCADMLEEELVAHASGVMRCTPSLALTVPGADYIRFAAVSLAYNVGIANWCGSTARKLLDAGQKLLSCGQFRRWNRAGGQVVSGLTLRREREWEACTTNLLPGKTPANLHARMKAVG